FDTEVESTERSYVFVGRETLQAMLGIGDNLSEISLTIEDKDYSANIVEQLQAATPALSVTPWQKIEPLIVALTKIQSGFLLLWFLIVVSVVAFGLINTLFMAIFERTREIGLLQALGMRSRQIVLQIVLESGVLLAFGLLIGNSLSALTLLLLHRGIDVSAFAQGTAMFGAGRTVHPELWLTDLLTSNLLVLCLGLVSSIYPAWRAGAFIPSVAMRRT
ncbi:MAG: FtsX-like permease family protein, partial [Bdellovibrionales bacterium]|nr:FtsX-like permease family protein [Bdellovibrionales bacterium]